MPGINFQLTSRQALWIIEGANLVMAALAHEHAEKQRASLQPSG